MVSFELVKEIEKDVFYLVTSMGHSTEGSIPHGDSEVFLCPTLVTRQKNIFLQEWNNENYLNLNIFEYWFSI